MIIGNHKTDCLKWFRKLFISNTSRIEKCTGHKDYQQFYKGRCQKHAANLVDAHPIINGLFLFIHTIIGSYIVIYCTGIDIIFSIFSWYKKN